MRTIHDGKLCWLQPCHDGTIEFLPINEKNEIDMTPEVIANIIGQDRYDEILLEAALGPDWKDKLGGKA